MEHLIAYEGRLVSLAVLQEEYAPLFLPWPNRRVDVSGTIQRPPYTEKDFTEWMERLRGLKGKHEVFAVLINDGESRTYTGHMGLHDATWPDACATTGSILIGGNKRPTGCGTEAKLLLQYHAFRVMGLRKLYSEVKAFNGPSLGHLLKCGYKVIGRRTKHHFHEGTYVDNLILECFREDWEPVWDAYQIAKELPKLTEEQRTFVKEETNQT